MKNIKEKLKQAAKLFAACIAALILMIMLSLVYLSVNRKEKVMVLFLITYL